MKFEITSRQRDIFREKGFIEFSDFFSLQWISLVKAEVKELLSKHSRIQNGLHISRDLWRNSKTIRSLASMNKIVKTAAALFYPSSAISKYLQLAFDQFIQGTPKMPPLLPKVITLESLSCIKPLAGFVFFRINATVEGEELISKPQNLTSIVFLAPSYAFKPEEWFKVAQSEIFMIAYAKKNALYLLENRDPCTHDLKRLGYVFGDRLNETLHPIIHS